MKFFYKLMRLEYLLQVLASCTWSTNKGCCLAAALCAMCRALHCSGTRSAAALWLDKALLTCSDDIFCHLPDVSLRTGQGGICRSCSPLLAGTGPGFTRLQ